MGYWNIYFFTNWRNKKTSIYYWWCSEYSSKWSAVATLSMHFFSWIWPWSTALCKWNVHPLEVVDGGSETQLQVSEIYSNIHNLNQNRCRYIKLNAQFLLTWHVEGWTMIGCASWSVIGHCNVTKIDTVVKGQASSHQTPVFEALSGRGITEENLKTL